MQVPEGQDWQPICKRVPGLNDNGKLSEMKSAKRSKRLGFRHAQPALEQARWPVILQPGLQPN